MKPGSKRDPWREFWQPGLGIYLQVWKDPQGRFGVSFAWTPAEDPNAVHYRREQYRRAYHDMNRLCLLEKKRDRTSGMLAWAYDQDIRELEARYGSRHSENRS